MYEPEYLDARDNRPRPIRHRELSAELLAQIKTVHKVIGPLLRMTLEQFEIGFMRNQDPREEVAIWLHTIAAWRKYHEKYLGGKVLADAREKSLLAAFLSICGGIENANMMRLLGAPVKVGLELSDRFDELGNDQ